jgi:peroxiredoxin
MLLLSRSWVLVISASLALAGAACQPKTATKPAEDKQPAAQDTQERVAEPAVTQPAPKAEHKTAEHKTAEHKTAVHKPKPESPPPPPTIPKVALSNADLATCLVNVGQSMPAAELPDPAGKMQALDSLYGPKLTVVCFWTIGATPRARLVAAEALHDLVKAIVEPFGEKGVQVVGINVGDKAEAVQQLGPAGTTFPNLLDAKGELIAKIAKDKKMPRVFLLDAGGRVLWFDVEFSRSSRQDLVQAIRAVLSEP